jgi:hypothetical protein
MSNPAVSIFSRVLSVPESTFNTLPASPTMNTVPFVDCSLALDITKVQDNTIQGDTMHRSVSPTISKVAGTISGELTHTNADWFFEGLFYNNFSANTVKVGTSQKSYSIEVGSSDIGQYFLYSGCVIDKFSMTVAPAGLVTFKADFVGASSNVATVTHATSVTAAAATPVMTATNATIKEGGSIVAYITGGTFSFDRKHTVNHAIGNSTPVSISTSFFNATGTLDVFLEDQVMYSKFLNNSNSSIDWTFTDGTNTYEVTIPKIYYTTFARNVTGTGPIIAKINFTGVYDTSSATSAQVTRSS